MAATVIAFYLTYLIAKPFIVPLIWAATLAVLAFPVYRRAAVLTKKPALAAALTTLLLAVVVAAPIVLVAQQVGQEIFRAGEYLQEEIKTGSLRGAIEGNRYGAPVLRFVEQRVDLRSKLEQAATNVPKHLSGFLAGSLSVLFQSLVTFFALFFLFRDHKEFLRGVRRLVPLSRTETDSIFRRVYDTLFAAVFGEILIAVLQGALGGVMFWILGLPAPFLWGFVMAVFSFLPLIGGWMIWAPAAVYLFMQGEAGKGVGLLVWGITALTILPTFLYPTLVGERMRLHTLLVFIAILGGIAAFDTVGIVLGPLALALTIALVDVWRKRLGAGEPLSEEPEKDDD